MNTTFEILRRRQRLSIKIYAALCAIVLAIAGIVFFQKWQEYSYIKGGVVTQSESLEVLKENVINTKTAYLGEKDTFEELNKSVEQKLDLIFPAGDDYTILTRQFDQYEEEITANGGIFEISSISFDGVGVEDDYAVLPLRMVIRSSRESFTEFLHLLESSGSLNDGIRLMDISSVRLNFQGKDADIINFTVQINAYFQSING